MILQNVEQANKALGLEPTAHELSQWARPKGDITATLLRPYIASIYFVPEDFSTCDTINDVREMVMTRAEEVLQQQMSFNNAIKPARDKFDSVKKPFKFSLTVFWFGVIVIPVCFLVSTNVEWMWEVTEVVTEVVIVLLMFTILVDIVRSSSYKRRFKEYGKEFTQVYDELIHSEGYEWMLAAKEESDEAKARAREKELERAAQKSEALAEWRKRQVEQAAIRSVVYQGTKSVFKSVGKALSK